MQLANYPHQSFSLSVIRGEKWKDIPGLEGYYQLSTLGRVKRLEYEMQYSNGAVYVKQEKIIKPSIVKHTNKFKNDTNYYLANRVTVEGIRYNLTIARLVFHCFVKKFDLKNKSINILCKDGDSLNIRPANLIQATLSEKGKRIYQRKRMVTPFKNLDPASKNKQRQAIAATLSKQMSQYTLAGKKIKTFPSAALAERSTGISATSIGKVASGNGISAGGFGWQWGNAARIDLKAIQQTNKIAHRKKFGQKVSQYDFNGKKTAQYPSLQDAEAKSGAHQNAIRLVLKGIYKSAKGFYWQKGYGSEKIDLSGYCWGRNSMAITQSKKVKQFSLTGKLIQIHPSIIKAAASIGVTPSVIVDCCRGRQKTSRNYKWEYA